MKRAILTLPDDERSEALLAFLRALDFVQLEPVVSSEAASSHQELLEAWADAQAGRNLTSVDLEALRRMIED